MAELGVIVQSGISVLASNRRTAYTLSGVPAPDLFVLWTHRLGTQPTLDRFRGCYNLAISPGAAAIRRSPFSGCPSRECGPNLISNAIKCNVEQCWIRISAAAGPKQVEVRVANSSTGIRSAERDKVFDRFYRADIAHGRNVEGVGRGLSVSREIARAHGGDITLRTDSDGTVDFSLLLPS